MCEVHFWLSRWELIAVLPMYDPPRHDTKQTIEHCLEKGIQASAEVGNVAPEMESICSGCHFAHHRMGTCSLGKQLEISCFQVKMVTGDQLLIGKETAKQLGMGTNMYTTEELLHVSRFQKSFYLTLICLGRKCQFST